MTIHKKMALLFFYLPIQATYCSSSLRAKSEDSTLPSSVKKTKKYVLEQDNQRTIDTDDRSKLIVSSMYYGNNLFESKLNTTKIKSTQTEENSGQSINTGNITSNSIPLQQDKNTSSIENWVELKVKNCMLLQVDKENSTMKGRVIPTPCGNIKVNFVCMAIAVLYRKYFKNSFN